MTRRGTEGRTRRRRPRRRRMGSVIIFALTVLTPVLVASGTVLSSLHAYAEEVEHRIHGVTAQLIAASGAHEALARLNGDSGFRGRLELRLDGGRSAIDVTQIAGDETPDRSDDLIQVRSEGWLNGPDDGESGLPRNGIRWYRSVVTATVRPHVLTLPVEQTLYIADPAPRVMVDGTAFHVGGEDIATKPKASLPGIGVTGDPSFLTHQVPDELKRYITGSDSDSGMSVRASGTVDIAAWMERFRQTATVLWHSSNERVGSRELGNDEAPIVAFAESGLNLRGTISGRGVLAVQGDLRVTGTLDFAGIILVTGSAVFRGTGGDRTMHRGALLIGGTDSGRDLEIQGDVQLLYDSSAIDGFVGQFIDGVELVSWDHDLDAGADTTTRHGSLP